MRNELYTSEHTLSQILATHTKYLRLHTHTTTHSSANTQKRVHITIKIYQKLHHTPFGLILLYLMKYIVCYSIDTGFEGFSRISFTKIFFQNKINIDKKIFFSKQR